MMNKHEATYHNMKKYPTLILALLLTIMLPASIMAGPARRGTIRHSQPDGTSIQLRLIGDEFGHTFTTLDGRPVDVEENGAVRFRTAKEIKELQASHDALQEACRAQSSRKAGEPIRKTGNTAPYHWKDFTAKGEIHGVVLLVEFANISFSQDSATIHDLLEARYNADHYIEPISYRDWSAAEGDTVSIETTITGSAHDYFRDQSFGQFTPSFDVIGPLRLDNDRIYYGGNNRSGSDSNVRGMIKDACQKAYASGLTDFSRYDNDGDGSVDFVFVVFAGNDEAQFGPAECVWAQAGSLASPMRLGEVSIYDYACSAELCYDTKNIIGGIGTFVHEFSHVIGLPDFYNTNLYGTDTDFAMDYWSVMDYGLYNCEGFVPAAYTSFERYSLGWLPMQTLDKPGDITLEQTDNCRMGYRVFVNEEDTTAFYIFENIQKNGWNSFAPSYGLQITCVNYNASSWRGNTVNTNKQKHRYYIVPANNDYNYQTANEHLFGKKNHDFGPDTQPASITQFGDTLNRWLTDIQRVKEGPVTFKYMEGGSGIATASADSQAEVYTLDGKRIDISSTSKATLPKGIYIVREGGKTRKRLVM